MNTLIKVIVTIVISLFLCSCEFITPGVIGNGNVINQDRVLSESFNAIEVSHGIDLEVSMSQNPEVLVIADENIAELITTEVKNNTLYIQSEKIIGSAKSKKVVVGITELKELQASSGAHLWGEGTLKADVLVLKASSGAELSANIVANTVEISASSGAHLDIEGSTNHYKAKSSSGGHINTANLLAKQIQAKASSGGHIVVHKTDQIAVEESSGGHVDTAETTLGSSDVTDQ